MYCKFPRPHQATSAATEKLNEVNGGSDMNASWLDDLDESDTFEVIAGKASGTLLKCYGQAILTRAEALKKAPPSDLIQPPSHKYRPPPPTSPTHPFVYFPQFSVSAYIQFAFAHSRASKSVCKPCAAKCLS